MTKRAGLLGLLMATFVACGPSLSDAARVWCLDYNNRLLVDEAAGRLGIIRTSFFPEGTSSRPPLTDPDFIRACNAAFEAR